MEPEGDTSNGPELRELPFDPRIPSHLSNLYAQS